MSSTEPEFGLCLPQFTSNGDATVAAAITAEADGYDIVSVFDHLRPLGGPPGRPILECLTLLAAVAAATRRVRMLPLVLRAPLRPAATVGSVFRTLALLAPDRVILGVGGGDRLNEGEDRSVGLAALTPEQRRESVRALVGVVRAQAPQVPVWLGGTSAAMRAMTGEVADGWNIWGRSPAVVAAGASDVRASAAAAGRPSPRITWGGPVLLAGTVYAATSALDVWAAGRSDAERAGVVHGDAAAVHDQLAALRAAGVQSFLLSFIGPDAATARRKFAQNVLPVVRPADVL